MRKVLLDPVEQFVGPTRLGPQPEHREEEQAQRTERQLHVRKRDVDEREHRYCDGQLIGVVDRGFVATELHARSSILVDCFDEITV